jgi:hypothetical protein
MSAGLERFTPNREVGIGDDYERSAKVGNATARTRRIASQHRHCEKELYDRLAGPGAVENRRGIRLPHKPHVAIRYADGLATQIKSVPRMKI